MKYLLEFPPQARSPFLDAPLDIMEQAIDKLKTALKDGSIDCAYTKVGGGGLMVVNSSSHEALARILRTYHTTDVTVTPLLDTIKVMEAYTEARDTTDAKWWHRSLHKLPKS